MLHSSVSSSSVRTPAVVRSSELTVHMNAAVPRKLIQMHRLSLSRILGGWAKAGASSGLRTSIMGVLQAPTAQIPGAPTRAFGASESGAPETGTGPRVVILGGGFGGLYAAVRLDQLLWPRGKKPQITLVDQSDRFVFKPLLYELVNGTATSEEVAPSLSQLLAPYPVRFVQAQVAGVHPLELGGPQPSDEAAGYVALSDGTSLPYDYLLVALGSQPDSRGVPGVREWAVPFNSFEEAVRVKGTLDLLVDSGAGGSVVVVGGGYAGVELAAMVGERLRGRGEGGALAVQLLTPGLDILEGSPEGQRAAANKALADLGVTVMKGVRVEALGPPDADAKSSHTALPTACTVSYSPVAATDAQVPPPSQQLAADLVIWTAGNSPAIRETRDGFPFPTNARGAIETEPSLRVQGSNVVFALGDVAVSSSAATSAGYDQQPQTLPATAQVAFQQADYAAWNIWAAINSRPLLPFRYQHLGSMMSLGQVNAAVSLPLELPPPLTDAVRSSPLGPLLGAAGVRLGGGAASAVSGNGVTLEGPLAALLRRAAYLYRQPTNEQRISVATSWLRMGLEAAVALAGGRGASR